METRYLEEFLVLAKITNYGQAANTLFTTQSTLFSHIKSLERELGVSLFERSGNKIMLSDYGSIFIPYAKTIIDSLNDYDQTIQSTLDEKSTTIRIGTHYQVIDLVQQFKYAHNNCKIQLFSNYNLLDTLIDGKCDLSFIRDFSQPNEQCDHIHFFTDHVVAVLYDTHPLVNRKSISLNELKNEKFIICEQPPTTFDLVLPLCKTAGFMPKISIVASTRREAALFVNDRHGISLFYKGMVKAENLDNLVLVDLDPPIQSEISLHWKKDAALSEEVKMFIEFAKDFYQNNGTK